MKFYEKVINFIYHTMIFSLIAGLICICLYFVGKVGIYTHKQLKKMENQEEQVDELYNTQAFLFNVIRLSNELQRKVNFAIIDDLVDIRKKPSYNYLKSVTVYMARPTFMIQEDGELRQNGIAGTGTIVAQKNGYYYILTNKHICGIAHQDGCFIIDDNNDFIKLDYVKQTESKYDLSLWRTNYPLTDKRAIKGLNYAVQSDPIYLVGHHLGKPYIYGEGIFAGYSGDFALIQIPTFSGNSGSGVFNKNGELVAIVFAMNIAMEPIPTAIHTHGVCVDSDIIYLFLADILALDKY